MIYSCILFVQSIVCLWPAHILVVENLIGLQPLHLTLNEGKFLIVFAFGGWAAWGNWRNISQDCILFNLLNLIPCAHYFSRVFILCTCFYRQRWPKCLLNGARRLTEDFHFNHFTICITHWQVWLNIILFLILVLRGLKHLYRGWNILLFQLNFLRCLEWYLLWINSWMLSVIYVIQVNCRKNAGTALLYLTSLRW